LSRSVTHLPILDGLRAVAVLLVLWAHVNPHVAGYPQWLKALRAWDAGAQGVDLFFVLSGFLITRILLAEQQLGLPVRRFMLRRLLRIFPIYYLLLLIMWFAGGGPVLPWCAVYLSNVYSFLHGHTGWLEHTWSLCIEEHFYLLWPPVVAFCARGTSLRVLLYAVIPFGLLLGAFLTVLLAPEDLFRGLHYLSPVRFLSLGLGCLMAFGETRITARAGRWTMLGIALCVLGVLVTPPVLVPILIHLEQTYIARPDLAPVSNLLSAMLLSSGLMLCCLGAGPRSPLRLWQWAPLRAIGRISYGLYLYHWPIFALMYVTPTGASALLAIGLSFAAATLSYWLIERPILRFGARFR